MKTIRVLFSILIISTVINSTNCFSKTKSTSKIFDRTAWIPADFNPENIVLLIDNIPNPNSNKAAQKMYEKETKNMEEVMQKYYPYPYEFVKLASANSIKLYNFF